MDHSRALRTLDLINTDKDGDGFICQEAMPEFQALIEELQAYERGDLIENSWHIDDVKNQRPDLSDEQCREVLAAVERRHDATIGINWDTIDFWAEELFPESVGGDDA